MLSHPIESANETGVSLTHPSGSRVIADADGRKDTTETIEGRKMIHAYRVAILHEEGGPRTG